MLQVVLLSAVIGAANGHGRLAHTIGITRGPVVESFLPFRRSLLPRLRSAQEATMDSGEAGTGSNLTTGLGVNIGRKARNRAQNRWPKRATVR
jgi:hypothetical protein